MRPAREHIERPTSAYFVSTQTARRQRLFRHDRWAKLLIETILHYRDTGYGLHAYVIMPDHVHLLITPADTLERAVQLFKGGFSFRVKRELGWKFDVWQSGFTDHRIRNEEDWNHHLEYIRGNPVEARLVDEAGSYPYLEFPSPEFPQGLKPGSLKGALSVRAKARTLQSQAPTLQSQHPTLQSEARTLPSDHNEVHV